MKSNPIQNLFHTLLQLKEVDVKQPMVVGAGKFQDQDDEDFIEPPFISKYNNLIKLLKQKNIPYTILDKKK